MELTAEYLDKVEREQGKMHDAYQAVLDIAKDLDRARVLLGGPHDARLDALTILSAEAALSWELNLAIGRAIVAYQAVVGLSSHGA